VSVSWAIGYDSTWNRDIGYGVPAVCDHPGCGAVIDRGLAYVCGGDPYGGERGCGLFFCGAHLLIPASGIASQLCERCYPRRRKPFAATPDVPAWNWWRLNDGSWQQWRQENPAEVEKLRVALVEAPYVPTNEADDTPPTRSP
jgi:hypothetical protein